MVSHSIFISVVFRVSYKTIIDSSFFQLDLLRPLFSFYQSSSTNIKSNFKHSPCVNFIHTFLRDYRIHILNTSYNFKSFIEFPSLSSLSLKKSIDKLVKYIFRSHNAIFRSIIQKLTKYFFSLCFLWVNI